MNKFYKISMIFIFLVTCTYSLAQSQVVTGVVKDAGTKQPIGFCDIRVLKSPEGAIANASGKFQICQFQKIY